MVVIASILLLILGGGFLLKFLTKPHQKKSISPMTEEKSTEDLGFDADLKEWRDPAGFAFLYPDDLQITSMEEDEVNYAHLKLTKENTPGEIEIICGDSQFSNLDDWVEEDEEVKEGSALETTMASMSAKKIALKDGKEIAALIDVDQVIYLIKKDSAGREYWNRVFRAILDTFKLIPLEGESEVEFQQWLGDFDTSGVDIVEPVEVIE